MRSKLFSSLLLFSFLITQISFDSSKQTKGGKLFGDSGLPHPKHFPQMIARAAQSVNGNPQAYVVFTESDSDEAGDKENPIHNKTLSFAEEHAQLFGDLLTEEDPFSQELEFPDNTTYPPEEVFARNPGVIESSSVGLDSLTKADLETLGLSEKDLQDLKRAEMRKKNSTPKDCGKKKKKKKKKGRKGRGKKR